MTAINMHSARSTSVLFFLFMLVAVSSETNAAQISGCTIFPPDNPWNRDVSSDPLDPNSTNYINQILTGSNRYLFADFAASSSYGIPFNVVSGWQEKVSIQIVDYPHESDPGPYPVPGNAKVEAGTDHHLLVLDKDNALLYEMFNASYVGPGWKCSSAAKFDLKSNALRPAGWTSADAAGLPILPGLVRYDEVASGAIEHALRFTVHVAQNKYVYPATHPGTSTNTTDPPMGLRLRLKASYDISKFTGSAKVILTALKKYGMFVADRGSDWYLSGAPDSRWNDVELRTLRSVPGSAFEVVRPNYSTPPTSGGSGTGTGTGLNGQYFDNKDFTGTSLTRTDETVNFNWGSGAPVSGFGVDTFSVRWTGHVQPQYSQTYTFFTQSDDGVRLWVNGQLLINDWTDHGPTENAGAIALAAGQKYEIKLEYYDSGYTAVAKLLWSSAYTPKAIIPKTQLYPSATTTTPTTGGGGGGSTASGTGLSATYFNSTDLSGSSITRNDPTVNFAWGSSSPATGINADNFSVRWKGEVQAAISEYYTFYTRSDDGVRLWVNGQKLVDNWTHHGETENSGGLWLSAGQRYSITMEYFESAGDAVAKLLWSAPGVTKGVIPQTHLYPATMTTTPTTPPPPSSGDGLLGTYFNNSNLTGSTAVRIDKTINFDWGFNPPISSIEMDSFSVRWTGTIQPQYSQTYRFYALTDDGVTLWINNQLVIDRWRDQSATEASGTITLSAGVKYPIKMEYYDGWGGAVAKLYWSSTSTPKQIVPQSQLSSGASAVEAPEAVIAEMDSSSLDGDSDLDGFSDELEVSLDTSPTDPQSTPFNGAPAGPVQSLRIQKLTVKLNFKSAGRDTLRLAGTIPSPSAQMNEGSTFAVSIGGRAALFTVDLNGRAQDGENSLKLTYGKSAAAGGVKFQVTLAGDLAGALDDEALDGDRDAIGAARSVNAVVLFNQTVYQTQQALIYSAKAGRTGKAFISR